MLGFPPFFFVQFCKAKSSVVLGVGLGSRMCDAASKPAEKVNRMCLAGLVRFSERARESASTRGRERKNKKIRWTQTGRDRRVR